MTVLRILAGFCLLLYALLAIAGGADGKQSNALTNGAIGLVGLLACAWVIYRFGRPGLSWMDWLAALIAVGPLLYFAGFILLKKL